LPCEIFSEKINAAIFGPPIGRGPPRIAGSVGSVVTPLRRIDKEDLKKTIKRKGKGLVIRITKRRLKI